MKTSWSEAELIEKHIQGFSDRGDALLFEAKLMLDNDLIDSVHFQRKTYGIIQAYGRRQLKQEIEAAHQKLFHTGAYQSFSQKIRQFFINK